MGIKSCGVVPTTALALGLFFVPPVSIAIDAIVDTVAPLAPPTIGNLGFTSPAMGQPVALTSTQSEALNAYNDAVKNFESILGQRQCADQFETGIAEPAGTSALPCAQQHDERV